MMAMHHFRSLGAKLGGPDRALPAESAVNAGCAHADGPVAMHQYFPIARKREP